MKDFLLNGIGFEVNENSKFIGVSQPRKIVFEKITISGNSK
jgi:hypothetical protein